MPMPPMPTPEAESETPQAAQFKPGERVDSDEVRRRLGSQPAKPPAAPPTPSAPPTWVEEGEVDLKKPNAFGGAEKRAATRMMQGINRDVTGKNTIDIPDDFGRNTQYPLNKEDLDSWYTFLSKTRQEDANQFQRYLKEKGYTGWFDPKIKGKDLEMRNWLFDQTSGQWNRRSMPGEKPAKEGEDTPENFFKRRRRHRSELSEDKPALASLGGNYMGDDDA